MSAALISAIETANGQVVNTDSDGLLSALLVNRLSVEHAGRPLPVVGFYDNERLWLTEERSLGSVLDDPSATVWIDADVRVRGATVVSQHVVHHPDVPELREPPPDVVLINPNYLDHAAGRPYRGKYPFSTAAWIWALAPHGLPPVTPRTPTLTGLLWAQDGGHESVAEHRFRDNCLEWALDLVEGMPLAPAALALRGLAADARVGPYLRDEAIVGRAQQAEEVLRERLRGTAAASSGWQSQQWCFSARQRTPLCDPAAKEGLVTIQRFVDALAGLVGIPEQELAPTSMRARGRWQMVRLPGQAPWDEAFSLARTYTDGIACTLDMCPA